MEGNRGRIHNKYDENQIQVLEGWKQSEKGWQSKLEVRR
jgi:hypothetical protein